MRIRLFVVALAAVLAAGTAAAAEKGTSYGAGVTLATPVAIAELLANPGTYLGADVRVDGVVTGVCERRGCWIQVTDPELGKGVRIKVEDGVIVFPPSAMGRKASAQGVFEALPGTAEQHHHDHAGHEDAKGETAHNCASQEQAAPTRYQIRGTGAVVY